MGEIFIKFFEKIPFFCILNSRSLFLCLLIFHWPVFLYFCIVWCVAFYFAFLTFSFLSFFTCPSQIRWSDQVSYQKLNKLLYFFSPFVFGSENSSRSVTDSLCGIYYFAWKFILTLRKHSSKMSKFANLLTRHNDPI